MFVIHFWGKIEVIIIILLELLVKLLEKRLEITEESVVNRLSVSRNGSALKLLISGIHWGARQPEYAKSIVLTFVVRNTSALSGLPLCHSWVVTGVLAMKKWSLVYPGPKSKMYFLPMVVTANIPFWIDLILDYYHGTKLMSCNFWFLTMYWRLTTRQICEIS